MNEVSYIKSVNKNDLLQIEQKKMKYYLLIN